MEELESLLADSRSALASGKPPYAVAEGFFEAAIVPVSGMKNKGPRSPEAEALLVEAVEALMEWGRMVFAEDRDATRKLDQILKWAKHLAGSLEGDHGLKETFDTAYQDWHWRGW